MFYDLTSIESLLTVKPVLKTQHFRDARGDPKRIDLFKTQRVGFREGKKESLIQDIVTVKWNEFHLLTYLTLGSRRIKSCPLWLLLEVV